MLDAKEHKKNQGRIDVSIADIKDTTSPIVIRVNKNHKIKAVSRALTTR